MAKIKMSGSSSVHRSNTRYPDLAHGNTPKGSKGPSDDDDRGDNFVGKGKGVAREQVPLMSRDKTNPEPAKGNDKKLIDEVQLDPGKQAKKPGDGKETELEGDNEKPPKPGGQGDAKPLDDAGTKTDDNAVPKPDVKATPSSPAPSPRPKNKSRYPWGD